MNTLVKTKATFSQQKWFNELILDTSHVVAFIRAKRLSEEWIAENFTISTPYFISEGDSSDEDFNQMFLGQTSYGAGYVKRIQRLARQLDGLFDAGDGELIYYANKQENHICLIVAGEFAFFIAPRVSEDKIVVSFTK